MNQLLPVVLGGGQEVRGRSNYEVCFHVIIKPFNCGWFCPHSWHKKPSSESV